MLAIMSQALALSTIASKPLAKRRLRPSHEKVHSARPSPPKQHKTLGGRAKRRVWNRTMARGWVYIMTNKPNGTPYVGVTGNLARRVWEHREGAAEGFTKRYGLKRLGSRH